MARISYLTTIDFGPREIAGLADAVAELSMARPMLVSDEGIAERLAALVDTSISGKRAARDPSAFFAMRGEPELIVSEHGTEFEPTRAGLIRLD